MNKTLFFKDRPLFGLDIAPGTIRAWQTTAKKDGLHVVGYGVNSFATEAIKDGIITDPKAVAAAAQELMAKKLVGKVTARRVALAIPVARTYSRTIKLPALENNEIADAVRLEAEQYIPVPIDDLYLDYSILSKTAEEIELFAVATPKKIIDSYLAFTNLLRLEVVAIETTIDAATRLFSRTDSSKVPSVLIDFGTGSVDITIVDKAVIATGTVSGGSDTFIAKIAAQLGVNPQEATVIKERFGLNVSKKQQEITTALDPALQQLLKEVRRMIRYYEERYGSEHKINQLILMGVGADMPGLGEYMTSNLRLPVRTVNPWASLKFDAHPPEVIDRPHYVTAAGLSLISPQELFHD